MSEHEDGLCDADRDGALRFAGSIGECDLEYTPQPERLLRAGGDRVNEQQRITTPCPACGLRSIYIGKGGHLTCGNLKCSNPLPEDVVNNLKARVAELERTPPAHDFVDSFNALAQAIHANAVQHGFWPETGRNDGEIIALMHSELSEALEAIRHGNPPDDKIPEFSGLEAELADVIIRIMDMAPARTLRIAEALVAKVAYNTGRAHKHGKAF